MADLRYVIVSLLFQQDWHLLLVSAALGGLECNQARRFMQCKGAYAQVAEWTDSGILGLNTMLNMMIADS